MSIVVLADAAALAAHVAEWLVAKAEASEGRFSISLSGGSTPKVLYGLLAQEPLRSRMPWARVHLFFGDERFVPREHADSNFRMVKEALLDHVPLDAAQVHGFDTSTAPAEAATQYAADLKAFYGAEALDSGKPLFDVVLLGLGEDGHTASLFPGVAALQERDAWVKEVIGAKPEARLTLTYPVLESARDIAFVAAGAAKHDVWKRVLAGDESLPAAHVKGHVTWFVDAALAGE